MNSNGKGTRDGDWEAGETDRKCRILIKENNIKKGRKGFHDNKKSYLGIFEVLNLDREEIRLK